MSERRPIPNPYMRTDKADYQTHGRIYDSVWETIAVGAETSHFSDNPVIRLAQAAAQYAYHMHVVEFQAEPTTEARSGIAAQTGAYMRQFVHQIADLAQDALNASDTADIHRSSGQEIVTRLEGSRQNVSDTNYFIKSRDGYNRTRYVFVPMILLPYGWSLSTIDRSGIFDSQAALLIQGGFISPGKTIEVLDEVAQSQRYKGAPDLFDGNSGLYRYNPRWKSKQSMYQPKTARFVECRNRVQSLADREGNLSLTLFRRGGKGTPYNFAYARIHEDAVLNLIAPFLDAGTRKLDQKQLPGHQSE